MLMHPGLHILQRLLQKLDRVLPIVVGAEGSSRDRASARLAGTADPTGGPMYGPPH